MLRRVAFLRAILAGVAGALASELVARLLIVAGVPLRDLTHTLGTIAKPDASAAVWWPIGLFIHAWVGAIWAVFYAYFFWSLFKITPVLQGLVFSILPMMLAGFIMVPQLGLMHRPPSNPGVFGLGLGWGGPASTVLGHLIYGCVLGALYTRPVGSPVGREVARA